MKYIISVDLWLTARIGQLAHLLRSSSSGSGNISNWSCGAVEQRTRTDAMQGYRRIEL